MKPKKLEQLVKVAKHFKTAFSFKQMPPMEKNKTVKAKGELDGTDLFSHFTADIIKEEAMFTR